MNYSANSKNIVNSIKSLNWTWVPRCLSTGAWQAWSQGLNVNFTIENCFFIYFVRLNYLYQSEPRKNDITDSNCPIVAAIPINNTKIVIIHQH